MPVWDAFSDMEALRREMERRFLDVWPGHGAGPRVAFLPGRAPGNIPSST